MRRGDFAAGKLISEVLVQDITTDNFEQFVTDVESKFTQLGCDAEMGAAGAAVDGVVGDTGLLGALLAWHDGGVPIGEFFTLSAQEIVDNLPNCSEGFTPVMRDLNGDLMLMDADSNLFVDGEGLGMKLAGFCGLFRDELVGGSYEWADGWVKKG